MFNMLENLTKSALNVVATPVAVVADIATLGGTLTDKDKPYTKERLEEAKECFDEAVKAKKD